MNPVSSSKPLGATYTNVSPPPKSSLLKGGWAENVLVRRDGCQFFVTRVHTPMANTGDSAAFRDRSGPPTSSRTTPPVPRLPRAQCPSSFPPTSSSSSLPPPPSPIPTGATHIDEHLATINRQRHIMPGLGNCLPEAIAHAMSYLPEEGHPHLPRVTPLQVRERIANEEGGEILRFYP
jgi:hypothetical protein